jgi:hypothetical protein
VAPGTYELRLFSNNTLTRLATSNSFTVQDATLTASPTTASAGGTITASWSGILNPTPNDWIGIYAIGAPDNSPLGWQGTSGTGSGSISFVVPAAVGPGTYELRLFSNNTLTRMATSNSITVQ